MKTVEIQGNIRESLGKKSTRDLRRADMVPCVVYGGEKTMHFSAHTNDFRNLIYTGDFTKAAITLNDGTELEAIVKEAQFHPVTDELMHIDFLQLVPGKKLKADIPIRLVGNAKGVKEGGALVQKMRRLRVITLPGSLDTAIKVDVTELLVGDSIRVRDIPVDENTKVMNSGSIPVASIEIPRALRSASSKVAEGEEGELEGEEEGEEAAAE